MNFTLLFILYIFVLLKGPIKKEPRYLCVCIAKYDKYVQVFKFCLCVKYSLFCLSVTSDNKSQMILIS